MFYLNTQSRKLSGAVHNNIVNPLESSFLKGDGLNVAVTSEHGNHVTEANIPFEPIRIPGARLAVSR